MTLWMTNTTFDLFKVILLIVLQFYIILLCIILLLQTMLLIHQITVGEKSIVKKIIGLP